MSQKQLIQDLLELECRNDPRLDRFVVGEAGEPLFVKNLETVQGDERDVIFVSVGYGPRIAGGGLDSMSFGPVSSEGGERRLNVLFTRARFRCEVFVSFSSGEIDLERTTQRGPAVLKRFLKFGETGVSDLPSVSGGFDSPFEEAVVTALHHMGYSVDTQVGSSGFKIDIAIKHPNRPGEYMCAVECDGATYHSSRSARERDRLRQEILEGLGWKFYRIWSTDWFRDPQRERSKLQSALASFSVGIAAAPAKLNHPLPEPEEEKFYVALDATDASSLGAPLYEEANFAVRVNVEPHEVSAKDMADIVQKIVAIEGPVHTDEVARRVAKLFGKDRTGSRIQEAVERGLAHAKRADQIASSGKFWSGAQEQVEVPIRNRSNASATLRKADMLPPQEIAAAVHKAFADNGSMDMAELVVAVTRLFGFDRAGPDLKLAIEKVASKMVEDK